jgi:hypothetical protein
MSHDRPDADQLDPDFSLGYWGEYASSKKTGRSKDAGSGGVFKNQTEDKSKPLYRQNPTKKPSTPGFLIMQEAVNPSVMSGRKGARSEIYLSKIIKLRQELMPT